MKNHLRQLSTLISGTVCSTILFTALVFTSSASFASPEQEKIFLDTYKKAFEGKDEATLNGLLYTKDADPEVLEFYKLMITGEMGSKIDSIELRPLTPDEVKEASSTMPSMSGEDLKLPVTPSKKLVIKIKTSDSNGNSSSSSESFVAEVDGKFLIPVPAKVK
ncbi:MAG TPA: hypothetical protein PKA63_13100 [Oligoflexia bacterium]|nr:hypothetical protein [Oligoflexia bacterium]HMP49597.1 hypothetical protein [Oligoflexia bacterium]